LVVVSGFVFLRSEFSNVRRPKREITAHNAGGSGYRAECSKGSVLKQESAGMMFPDILVAKPKKTLRQGRADASSD
jgi:hypothetical protein